jgi:hypothetical protein
MHVSGANVTHRRAVRATVSEGEQIALFGSAPAAANEGDETP